MKVCDKLRFFRQSKNLTQEEIAEKLGWAVNTYAKIERGEADIKLEKLQQIAELMEIDTRQLLDNEKTLFYFADNCINNNPIQTGHYTILLSEAQCVHELDKAQLILELKDKEIILLREEIAHLKEIIGLLKK